jgi:hypothetical protein
VKLLTVLAVGTMIGLLATLGMLMIALFWVYYAILAVGSIPFMFSLYALAMSPPEFTMTDARWLAAYGILLFVKGVMFKVRDIGKGAFQAAALMEKAAIASFQVTHSAPPPHGAATVI